MLYITYILYITELQFRLSKLWLFVVSKIRENTSVASDKNIQKINTNWALCGSIPNRGPWNPRIIIRGGIPRPLYR